MPFDFNPESRRHDWEPDPEKLLINGCIVYAIEDLKPADGTAGTAVNLEQINLSTEYLIWKDHIMTVVKSTIAQQLLRATSIQFRGRFYKAMLSR